MGRSTGGGEVGKVLLKWEGREGGRGKRERKRERINEWIRMRGGKGKQHRSGRKGNEKQKWKEEARFLQEREKE